VALWNQNRAAVQNMIMSQRAYGPDLAIIPDHWGVNNVLGHLEPSYTKPILCSVRTSMGVDRQRSEIGALFLS
jgi:hypothetical protein